MKNTQTLKELREKDIKTLTKELVLMNEKLTKLRSDLAFRKLKNIRQITLTRRSIAQIWTILNQKAAEEMVKNSVSAKAPSLDGEVTK